MSYQAKTKRHRDEPFQYTTKFPDVPVAVSENRNWAYPFKSPRRILNDITRRCLSTSQCKALYQYLADLV